MRRDGTAVRLPAIGGAIAVRTPTDCGFTARPALWEVGEDSAAQTLAKVESGEFSWGALFWVSLMKGADQEEVVLHWLRLRDQKVPEKSRADLTGIALVFAELAGRWPDWNRVMGGVKMTESTFVNELMEATRLDVGREYVREAIRGRFPEALTPDVERAIADQPSLALLREWHAAVVRAKTAEDFLAVLRR